MSCLLRASKESIDWRLSKNIENSRFANLLRLPIFRVCFPPPLNTHQSPLDSPPTPGKSRLNQEATTCILMERNDAKIHPHYQQRHTIVTQPDRPPRTAPTCPPTPL